MLEKAGLVCLVQSFASKAKNAAVWDPIFIKSYQTYYIYMYIYIYYPDQPYSLHISHINIRIPITGCHCATQFSSGS